MIWKTNKYLKGCLIMNKKMFKLFAAAIAAAGTITAFSAVSAGDIAVKSVDFAKGGKPVYLIEEGKINTVVNLEDGSAGSFSLLTVSYSEGGDRLLSINCKKITPESGKTLYYGDPVDAVANGTVKALLWSDSLDSVTPLSNAEVLNSVSRDNSLKSVTLSCGKWKTYNFSGYINPFTHNVDVILAEKLDYETPKPGTTNFRQFHNASADDNSEFDASLGSGPLKISVQAADGAEIVSEVPEKKNFENKEGSFTVSVKSAQGKIADYTVNVSDKQKYSSLGDNPNSQLVWQEDFTGAFITDSENYSSGFGGIAQNIYVAGGGTWNSGKPFWKVGGWNDDTTTSYRTENTNVVWSVEKDESGNDYLQFEKKTAVSKPILWKARTAFCGSNTNPASITKQIVLEHKMALTPTEGGNKDEIYSYYGGRAAQFVWSTAGAADGCYNLQHRTNGPIETIAENLPCNEWVTLSAVITYTGNTSAETDVYINGSYVYHISTNKADKTMIYTNALKWQHFNASYAAFKIDDAKIMAVYDVN